MSLRLYLHSFDWNAWQTLIEPPATRMVEEIAFAIQLQRETQRVRYGDESFRDGWPEGADELESRLALMAENGDWYAAVPSAEWERIDLLFEQIFRPDLSGNFGGLTNILAVRSRTAGILIETWDCGTPEPKWGQQCESCCMGNRRFHGVRNNPSDDPPERRPEYSIHCPKQVAQIFDEISQTDLADYPDEAVRQNFARDFLAPIEASADDGAGLFCRWT